ncbi:MAG: MinD/ParA family protein [Alicyclobacillaceae bacterium]|nr:MinD/ParA family protein [Alicyclobacillaceae bacterium]
MVDQAEELRRRLRAREANGDDVSFANGRVIVFASGKGGVGKSSLCVNFALALGRLGRRPVVIDADMGFANVEVLLGVRPSRTVSAILDGFDIWEVLQDTAVGLPFLSGGSGLFDIHDLNASEIDRMLTEVRKLRLRYDTVLIDSGAGLSANLARVIGAADDFILVTTPEPTAIADAYALLKLLVGLGDLPPTKVIVNRAASLVEGRIAADKLCQVALRFLDVRLDVLGYVLEDRVVHEAVMAQIPFVARHPHSLAAHCVGQLARNYVQGARGSESRGLHGFLERLFERRRSRGALDSTHPT